ncbi:MAG: shikimate dehydrogenase [Candidatus Omnitrophica bacterium]|nr:shikimate dehydrogenase [Candidatus Omnitrophota bacterium]
MNNGRVYGLVGNPIQHSLSPLMHNAAFSSLKIKAKYKLFPLERKELKPFLNNLKKRNICGLNITIPYKEEILHLVDGYLSSAVRVISAANTLVVDKSGKLKLFNTDYLGFTAHLRELKVVPRKAAIIGAGGAARAVCYALGKKKIQEVAIYDIDKFRSLSLMQRFNQIFPDTQFVAAQNIDWLKLKEKDILINTSPVGMKETDPLLVDKSQLTPGLFIYDLIYNPARTKLLKLAEENGLAYSNGLGMLLYQGAEAFDLWISPARTPVEAMRKALEKGVKKL